MKYEIVSDRPCFIDAIGEMKPNVPVILDGLQVSLFKHIHGYRVTEANFPHFVKLISDVSSDVPATQTVQVVIEDVPDEKTSEDETSESDQTDKAEEGE